MGEMWRLFIALELRPEIRAHLQLIQDDLKRRTPSRAVRWVDPTGMHLTLQFLGDVERGRVELLRHALHAAGSEHKPIDLATGKLGCFPNSRRPRVVWLGLTGQIAALGALQQSVERELKALGFQPEDRAYHPHLTLGRVRQDAPRPALDDLSAALEEVSAEPSPSFRAREVILFRSELKPDGAVYTALVRAPLAAP